MRVFIETLVIVVFSCLLVLGIVVFATTGNAYETKDLDDVVNRKTTIVRMVDSDTGVVCYFNKQHPQYISCSNIRWLPKSIGSKEFEVEESNE